MKAEGIITTVALKGFLNESYQFITDDIIPNTIELTYSFASGVALVTSLSAIVVNYLTYFSLQYTLAFVGPLAIGVGLVFGYLKYQENCRINLDLLIAREELAAAIATKENYQRLLYVHFAQNTAETNRQKRTLSLNFGENACQSPIIKDPRSWVRWTFDTVTRFIGDSGLTIGVAAFILVTFTGVQFAGFPLFCIVTGSLVMAFLTSWWVHQKRHQIKMQIDYCKEAKVHEDRRIAFHKNWSEALNLIQYEVPSNIPTEWWNNAVLEGYYREMLNEIKGEIRKYLIYAEVILIESKKTAAPFLPDDDQFLNRANKKLGHGSRNLMMAIKIALLIDSFKNNPEQAAALVHTIYELRLRARQYSFWSWFGQGRSRLADRLDEIFEKANDWTSQAIVRADPLDENSVITFELTTQTLFSKYKRLREANDSIKIPRIAAPTPTGWHP